MSHNAQDLGGSQRQAAAPRYDNETDVLLGGSGSKTFADEQRIQKPDFYLPPGLDRYGIAADGRERLSTSRRTTTGPAATCSQSVEQPKGLDASHRCRCEAAGRAADAARLSVAQAATSAFVVSDVSFEHLEGGSTWRQFSSTAELIRGLRNRSLDFGADERLAIHARLVQPLLDLTLLFLGCRWCCRGRIATCSWRSACAWPWWWRSCWSCWAASIWGPATGSSRPLAAWLPLMIFVPCAVQPLSQRPLQRR